MGEVIKEVVSFAVHSLQYAQTLRINPGTPGLFAF